MFTDQHRGTSGALDAVAAAKRVTVGFDDIDAVADDGVTAVENGYKKLDWFNMYAINPYYVEHNDEEDIGGYVIGVTSGDQDAFGGSGDPCSIYISDGTFSLNSVNMTAAWDTHLVVRVETFLDGQEVANFRVAVNDRGPTHFDWNFSGIDEVVFAPIRGKQDPNLPGGGKEVVFDDFVFAHIVGTAGVQSHTSHVDEAKAPPGLVNGLVGPPACQHDLSQHPDLAIA